MLGWQIVRFTVVGIVLLVASVWDIRKRIIPDLLPALIAAVSLLPPSGPFFTGCGVALILLIVGVIEGGVGGGDIKLVAALGLALGFHITFFGTAVALILLILFHVINGGRFFTSDTFEERSYPMAPFLAVGMAVSTLIHF